ncbi:MAG TPA: hypothetical protein PKB02_02650 [Anaerohalosphaeraceae bacterium]|nr:hypothetical protein [Anaerohalosphaeraceae bacterium]
MKQTVIFYILLFMSSFLGYAAAQEGNPIQTGDKSGSVQPFSLELLTVQKIWDHAPHNAFTDLIRFKEQWYCAFREGKNHHLGGSIRIIRSSDGAAWESAGLLNYPAVLDGYDEADMRDAKLSITPAGELMLSTAVAFLKSDVRKEQSLSFFSPDGTSWSKPYDIGTLDEWMWRTTWHKGIAYNFGYSADKGRSGGIQLYYSKDGKVWAPLGPRYFEESGFPNEQGMVFTQDDVCYTLLRRDQASCTAQLGRAVPPYDTFTWQDLGVRIGGPELIQLSNGSLLAAVRLYDGGPRTSLCWIDETAGTCKEMLKLPSGGDTSYAGIVQQEDVLWISYYSSHEGKAGIYLAKVRTLYAVK